MSISFEENKYRRRNVMASSQGRKQKEIWKNGE